MPRIYHPRQEIPRNAQERQWRDKMDRLRCLARLAFFTGDERGEREALMGMMKLLEQRKSDALHSPR